MGNGEFIEALRREGEEKIRTICQEAEAEAERIRGEAAGRISSIREDLGKTHFIALKNRQELSSRRLTGRPGWSFFLPKKSCQSVSIQLQSRPSPV